MSSSKIEHAFTNVYQKQQWGQEGGGSGSGSTEVHAAGASRIVFHVLMAFNLQSMIDAPCGAMVWQKPLMNQLLVEIPSFRYLGMDVVNSVVKRNQLQFEKQWSIHRNVSQVNPGFRVDFMHADLAQKEFPMPIGYDLILSRDALQHNRLDDVWQILSNFARSTAKYLLIGSYPDGSFYCRYTASGSPNIELAHPGGFYCIDLQRDPFSLVPKRVFREATNDRKTLYLFDRSELANQLKALGKA